MSTTAAMDRDCTTPREGILHPEADAPAAGASAAAVTVADATATTVTTAAAVTTTAVTVDGARAAGATATESTAAESTAAESKAGESTAAGATLTAAEDSGWLLALHSSSEQLGVAVLPWPEPPGCEPLASARLQAFRTGRDLANQLLVCLETLLPARDWPRLRRLAVATGPGGFTSTRLTVVLARTLAQQRNLPLDSRSSYHLNALRLRRQGAAPDGPFWLFQDLPRRGRVAGLYGPDPSDPATLLELEPPRLQDPQRPLSGPLLAAEPCLPQDVAELLAVCREAALQQLPAPWSAVVPLYPTGPVPQG